MAKPMPGPSYFCGHIAAVVGIYGRLKRHSADDLNSSLGQAIEFGLGLFVSKITRVHLSI